MIRLEYEVTATKVDNNGHLVRQVTRRIRVEGETGAEMREKAHSEFWAIEGTMMRYEDCTTSVRWIP